jgi:hypothetical protein
MTGQSEEPTRDASGLDELAPVEDNIDSVSPVDPNNPTQEPNEPIEESMEEEMSPTAESNESASGQNALIDTAVTDLAQHLNISEDEIEVVSFEAKTWSDTSMGCPHPEMAYLQVPQDGALIQLSVDGQLYEYHSGGNREPFLCEKTEKIIGAKPTPLNLQDFITPPSNIDN